MKKTAALVPLFICIVMVAETSGSSQLPLTAIDTVKPTAGDIPEGYMYGKVPAPYKATLKDNPWMMDRAAIRRLADKIYPGGDHNKIAGIHVSIIANKNTPLGDDIVCYVILYRDMKAAKDEIRKVTEFAGYNRDRTILLNRENMAVFLFVDDPGNFQLIQEMAKTIEERLKKI